MIALLERLSFWLSTTLMGIKPLEQLDCSERCPVCRVPILPDGRHDFGSRP